MRNKFYITRLITGVGAMGSGNCRYSLFTCSLIVLSSLFVATNAERDDIDRSIDRSMIDPTLHCLHYLLSLLVPYWYQATVLWVPAALRQVLRVSCPEESASMSVL